MEIKDRIILEKIERLKNEVKYLKDTVPELEKFLKIGIQDVEKFLNFIE